MSVSFCKAAGPALLLALILQTSLVAAQELPSNGCSVTAQVSSHWALETGASQYAASISLLVSNNGSGTIAAPWDLSIEGVGYSQVVQAFNWDSTSTSTGVINGTASLYWETLLPLAANTVNLGLIVQTTSNSSNVAPTSVSIAGQSCKLNITATVGASPSGAASESGGNPLTTDGGNIIGPDGNTLALLGINYFGFDDGNTMLDGLWAGSDQLTLDFATIVYRLQLLGFNAVRLPFSFQNIYNASPKSQTQSCSAVTTQAILSSVTHPGKSGVSSSQQVPQPASPAAQTPGVCNDYLPSDTTIDRFVWVVQYFTANNIYVLLDNQLNLDTTVLDNYQQWIQWWPDLVNRISQDPVASQKIMIDMLNEPDCQYLQWQAANGAGDLYLAAMDAIYKVNPDVLFFVEGLGQSGLANNWGDGICTDENTIKQYGISDPNPFFTSLMGRPYLSQVVVAPHIYPPSISKATDKYQGSGLYDRLSKSFGSLNKNGYCLPDKSKCHQFAVAIGETGTAFQDSRDTPSMASFAKYLTNTGDGNDGKHNKIESVFWWAWNANSGDTGGIVQQDWLTINWNKIDWMASVGLTPWYAKQGSSSSSEGAAIESFAEPEPFSEGGGFTVVTNASSSGTDISALAATAATTAGLTTANATIIGAEGVPVNLIGVTWPGFDSGNTMFDGLLDSASSFSQDFQTQVQRIISLGFNMVKIPFSFNDLADLQPLSVLTNCTLPTTEQLQSSVTNPGITPPPGRGIPYLNATAPTVTEGTCNSYLPDDSVLNRLLYVVTYLATNNLYVALSNNVTVDNTVATAPAMWIQSWATLVTAASSYEPVKPRLILDFIDYPDRAGLEWQSQDNGMPGSGDLYLAAMDAVNPINPSALFMIKGADQTIYTTNGGQGFVTDQQLITAAQCSNPNAFFRSLLAKSYSTQAWPLASQHIAVVLAPIIEPPSQTGQEEGFSGTPQYALLNNAFGYMNNGGYCATGNVCKNFPIMPEVGSPMASINDNLMMESLFSYMNATGLGKDATHSSIGSWIWNKWTPATVSEGTQGILTADYVTIDWNKVNNLTTIGLSPWYTLPTAHRQAGQATTGSGGDRDYLAFLQLTLANSATNAPIAVPYTLTVNNTNYVGVTQSNGLDLTDSSAQSGLITGNVDDYWNTLWPAATNNVTISLLLQGTDADLAPSQVKINALVCTLTDTSPKGVNSGNQPSAATSSNGV
ncbi:hypothetical protein ABBQ32_004742 [Trebouxia sp. C0010 RCD-2024]